MAVPMQLNPEMLPQAPNIQQLSSEQGGGSYLQAPIYNPQQQQQLSNLLEMGGQRLANPTKGFQPFEEQARKQFQTNTIPSLAERFTAMGGGQRSSAFQGALGQAGSDLESQLAGLRSQYGTQQEQVGLNMLNAGLQPQYHQIYQPPQADTSGLLTESAVGTGADLLKSFLAAPGSSFKEKLGNMFGLGGTVAGAVAEPLVEKGVEKAGEFAGRVLGAGVESAAEKLAKKTVPATFGEATKKAGAAGMAAAAPAATAALASKVAAGAAPVAKAATGTAALTGAAAIANTVGAVTLGATSIGLMGWIGYEIAKDLMGYEEPRRNPVPTGTYYTKEGNRVESKGKTVYFYDDAGNIIKQQSFGDVPHKPSKMVLKAPGFSAHLGKQTEEPTFFSRTKPGAK